MLLKLDLAGVGLIALSYWYKSIWLVNLELKISKVGNEHFGSVFLSGN
jgi:hypothetical protein